MLEVHRLPALEIAMRVATLIAWLLTVSLGGYMLLTWIARDGLRRERVRPSGLPPLLIFGHAGLGVTGLVLWIVYLGSAARVLAWSSVGCGTLGIALGLCAVTVWTPFPARRAEDRVQTEDDLFANAGFGRPGFDDPGFRVTDAMITRLLEQPGAEGRRRTLLPHLAAIIPIAHGLLALTTFALAVTVASMR